MVKSIPETALVTGGAGFIGSHLCEALLKEGKRVRILDNLSSGKWENLGKIASQTELIVGDIRDKTDVYAAVKGAAKVFHLAGLASVHMSQEDPALCLAINGMGTLNVLEACAYHKVQRLVYASTSAVYGDLPGPHDEAQVPKPNTPYAAVKLLGENLALFFEEQKGLRTISLRYFNVYGPRQSPKGPDSGVIPLFVLAGKKGEAPQVYGDGKQTRDFINVRDAVRAAILASEAKMARGVYNIGTGVAVTIETLLETLSEVMGGLKAPQYLPARPGDTLHSWAAMERAKKDLAFNPEISLPLGLKEVLKAF
ncbi:MAG: SDR family NAD(P)-dependent oxidoreductase [Deltaproteobacteria bacterium]|jgi:UDP-glucose 4-epimerase|nr:SDR family NAD(P)-dependent oxidoreductase [Deltaproteobacteria bacterium]